MLVESVQTAAFTDAESILLMNAPKAAISATPTLEEIAEIEKQKRRSFTAAFTDTRSTVINLNRQDDGTWNIALDGRSRQDY